jgi:dipeptidyl aminopeptidase/acylaminoacyl peptidase
MDCLTDARLSIHDFDWSPDGKQLAFAANEGVRWDGYMYTDLHVLDLDSGHDRVLVKQPGRDAGPVWSPDGRWIAFRSQKGRMDWQQDTQLAVVSTAGGEPTYPGDDLKEKAGSSPQGIRWSPDSRDIFLEAPFRMAHHLFRVPRAGGANAQVTLEDGRFYSQFSSSHDGTKTAFTIESATEPPDIYVAGPSLTDARRLTEVNPRLRSVARSAVEVVKWRSRDDKWDIHGVLVKPPDYEPGRRYPLLVHLVGGPQMVRMSYDLGSQYPIQVLASRGYVVLSPNTRGRDGYGLGFDRAIRDHGDYGPGPFLDMMAGVDALVANGIADPDRLGIVGFSYGGYLTAYSITQTARFRAASIGDAVNINMVHGAFHDAGDASRALLRQDLYGHGSPWKEAEYERMRAQSPIHQIPAARTPALLEFGERSNAPDNGRVLFQGLQAFHVPSEFVVYPRTGHGVEEPLLRKDSMERNVEWMDYWVLGQPTERMAKKWGAKRPSDPTSP